MTQTNTMSQRSTTSQNNPMTRLTIVTVMTVLWAASFTLAQPATQPAAGAGTPQRQGFGGGAGGRGEMLLQRFKDAMADLNLTDDQKTKIDAILDKAKDDARDMMAQMQNLQPQERQQKIRDLLMDLRQKIGDVLTDDQKQKLQEKLQSMRGPNARQGGGFGAGQGGGGAGAAGAGQPGAAKPDGAAAQPGNGQSANGQPVLGNSPPARIRPRASPKPFNGFRIRWRR